MTDANYAPPSRVMDEWRKHCSCDERFRPCDGVMAGGFCDDIHENDDNEYGQNCLEIEFCEDN